MCCVNHGPCSMATNAYALVDSSTSLSGRRRRTPPCGAVLAPVYRPLSEWPVAPTSGGPLAVWVSPTPWFAGVSVDKGRAPGGSAELAHIFRRAKGTTCTVEAISPRRRSHNLQGTAGQISAPTITLPVSTYEQDSSRSVQSITQDLLSFLQQ